MKIPIVTTCAVLILICAIIGAAQGVPMDSEPAMKTGVNYSMPQSVIDAEIDGTVVVDLRVDEQGTPTNVALVTGPAWPCGKKPGKALSDLSSSLTDEIKKIRFTPGFSNGKAVAKDVSLTIRLKNPNIDSRPPPVDPVTGKLKAVIVSAGILNGKAIFLSKPEYPAEARMSRVGGTVSVHVYINEEGKVIRAGAVNGATRLQNAARDAACSSKFSPTLLKGDPIKVSGIITYNFVPPR